jgi:hypothetical protein
MQAICVAQRGCNHGFRGWPRMGNLRAEATPGLVARDFFGRSQVLTNLATGLPLSRRAKTLLPRPGAQSFQPEIKGDAV